VQAKVQYLDISSRFKCHGSPCSQNGCTAVDRDSGLHRAAVLATKQPGSQSGWLRYAIWCICKNECTVARSVTSTIWKNDWYMNGAALISVSLTEQLASGDSVYVTASVIKASPLRYDTIESLTWTRKLSIQLNAQKLSQKLKQRKPVPL